MNNKSELYQNISPGTASWIGAGSGMRGVGFNFGATQKYGRAELYIDRGEREENKSVFDQLLKQRVSIEAAFGGKLEWERLDNRRGCRIKAEMDGNVFEQEQWPNMIDYMTDAMVKLKGAFVEPLNKLNKQLKSQ